MLSTSAKPMWEQIALLHADWVNTRALDESVALPIFLEHLADALRIGLVEVQVRSNSTAVQAGDQIVVGEWDLSGDLDLLRSALKAPAVNVRGVVHG